MNMIAIVYRDPVKKLLFKTGTSLTALESIVPQNLRPAFSACYRSYGPKTVSQRVKIHVRSDPLASVIQTVPFRSDQTRCLLQA